MQYQVVVGPDEELWAECGNLGTAESLRDGARECGRCPVRIREQGIVDYLHEIAFDYVPDESLAQAVVTFMADHIDSASTEEFVQANSGRSAERTAEWMTLPCDDQVDVAMWIHNDDLPAFREYAKREYGFDV